MLNDMEQLYWGIDRVIAVIFVIRLERSATGAYRALVHIVAGIAIAVGVAAGSFLAIATSNLLPQIHREGAPRGASLVFLFVGIAVMVGSRFAVAH